MRASIATFARKQMKPCGKPAKLLVKWPLRCIGTRVEIVEVTVCGEHAASSATTKFMENVPSDCYTADEVKLLAEHGMYVTGRKALTWAGRIKGAVKKLAQVK